ncbi:hypothetical protein ABTX60_13960 [Streptomyces sp. NPDC126510]|uniref:hypothetical protein n=1 Tax=Streptomyces sp. NPDC126510 TaxID=3155317 RepID=UPI00333497DD
MSRLLFSVFRHRACASGDLSRFGTLARTPPGGARTGRYRRGAVVRVVPRVSRYA